MGNSRTSYIVIRFLDWEERAASLYKGLSGLKIQTKTDLAEEHRKGGRG